MFNPYVPGIPVSGEYWRCSGSVDWPLSAQLPGDHAADRGCTGISRRTL